MNIGELRYKFENLMCNCSSIEFILDYDWNRIKGFFQNEAGNSVCEFGYDRIDVELNGKRYIVLKYDKYVSLERLD